MLRKFTISLLALMPYVLFSCEKAPDTPIPAPHHQEQDGEGGDNGNNGEGTPDMDEPTGRTVVVYYSFTGNCRSIASTLAEFAKADVMEIMPAEEGLDYAADNYAIGSSLIAAIRENPGKASSYPAIKPVSRNVADYDNIVIVTPLWWSNMAAIMQGYLFREGSKMAGKNVGLIVSSYSSGISSVVADARRLVQGARWTGDALWINNSNRSRSASLVKDWWDGFCKNIDTMPTEIKITVSGKSIPVKIEDNDATSALVAALRHSSITYEADDYGGFEKVGPLGQTLPSDDTWITTQPGDVILYSGDQIVLFYGSNSYNYTRIGKMVYGTIDELKSFLKAGQGKISVSLSL